MPEINALGQVLAGTGGTQGSLDGESFPFPSWGGGCWGVAPGSALVALQTGSLAIWDLTNPPTPLAPAGNDFAAGGNAWVAWRAGWGLYGSLESRIPQGELAIGGFAGPRSVGPDGTIAYVPDRQVGYGLVLVAPDKRRWDIPGINPDSVQVLGAGVVVWRGGALGREPLHPAVAHAAGVQVCRYRDQDWLLYWDSTTGLILQVDGATQGWRLDTREIEFRPSFAVVGEGDLAELQITWSITSGERPDDVVVCALTANGRIEYRVVAVGWQAQTPTWGVIAPPPPVVIPTFSFTHPVSVYPFKAEGSGQPDLFTLGIYSEAEIPPVPPPGIRLLLGHDSPEDWDLPSGLHPWDLPLIEFYYVVTESHEASVTRWERQLRDLLAQWPGDCGVIPMFYCQGGAPPNELWAVSEVLAGLQSLARLVNLSPRVKIIAPFAYARANGITAHLELQQAFDNLLTGAHEVGPATLIPVPKPPDPPQPVHPRHKGVNMEIVGKIVVLRGPGGRLTRLDEKNTGPWAGEGTGWRGLIFDGTPDDKASGDARYRFTVIPNGLVSEQTGAVLGCDATLHSPRLDQQFYAKPDGETGQGWAETWQFYDGNKNGAIEAQVEYAPGSGGDEGPFFSYPLAVEVVG